MKQLITHIFLLFILVALSLYLLTNSYFSPYLQSGALNWYNIAIGGLIVALLIYTLTFLVNYLFKKSIAYGKSEFPPAFPSFIQGLIVSIVFVVIILLHLFHILNLGWGVALGLAVILIISWIK